MNPHREVSLDRVVVAVDGDHDDRPTLAWAAATAQAHGLPLELHHCWRPTRVTGPPGGVTLPAIAQDDQPSPGAVRVLREATARAGELAPGLAVSGRLLRGDPVAALLGELTPADLLVLTARTRHRIAARAFGSITTCLLGHAPGPVALVPPEIRSGAGAFAGHVVIGVDRSPAAAEAVRLGFLVAERLHAPVAAVHAYRTTEFGSVIDEDTLETRVVPYPPQHRLLQAAVEPYRHTGVPIRRACFTGTPAQALLRAAEGARLLVLGRHQRPWHADPPVRLADLVLAEATCPLLLTAPIPTGTPVQVPAPRAATVPSNTGSAP